MEINLETDELLSTKQAAKLVKCSLATLYRFILKGKIQAVKRSGKWMVRKQDLVNHFLRFGSVTPRSVSMRSMY